MGFFDKLFANSSAVAAKPVIDSEQEAFITIIGAAAFSDGILEAEEWDTLWIRLSRRKCLLIWI